MEVNGRQGPLYNQPVNMARFFYLDNILLSVSANKLFIHSLKLPDSPAQTDSSHCKLSKGRINKISRICFQTSRKALKQKNKTNSVVFF